MRTACMSAAVALGGCTFEDGTGFATVLDGELSAEIVPGPARDLGGGEVLTHLGYHVAVDSAFLSAENVELRELWGGSAGGTFDPAHPPPGYTLCHGGHCHAEDGRLVDYAEVEAELAGGSAALAAVATLPVGSSLDLLAGEAAVLDAVEPSRELPQANLSEVAISVSGFALSGVVSAGAYEHGASVGVEIDIDFSGVLAHGIRRPVDRDHPPTMQPMLRIVVDGTLFDAIDFASEAAEGTLEVREPDDPLAESILTALLASEVSASLD